MKRRKILFIINAYPPTFSPNAMCDENIIGQIARNENIEIHCLCYKTPNFSKTNDKLRNVFVHRINSRDVYEANIRNSTGRSKKLLTILLLRLKQLLLIPIYPQYEPIKTLKLFFKAESLFKKYKFDAVISEHNGLETTMAAYYLKKKHCNIIFIPIFWDSLGGGFCAKYLPKKYALKRKAALEYKILKQATVSIMMEGHENEARGRISDQNIQGKIVYLNVPYFKKPSSNKKPVDLGDNRINIVFAGTLANRNPKHIVELARELKATNVCFHFFTDPPSEIKLKKLSKQLPRIVIHQFVDHETLIATLERSDFLLNIGVDSSSAVSGKIFEYMACGKPIISTYQRNDEASIPFLKKYPCILLLDENMDIEKNRLLMEAFISENNKKTIPFSQIEPDFRTSDPKTYSHLIQDVLEESLKGLTAKNHV